MSDPMHPIPGPDLGTCPDCGEYLKAGLLHKCQPTQPLNTEEVERPSGNYEPTLQTVRGKLTRPGSLFAADEIQAVILVVESLEQAVEDRTRRWQEAETQLAHDAMALRGCRDDRRRLLAKLAQAQQALRDLHAEVEMAESVGICLPDRVPSLRAGQLLADQGASDG